MNKKIKRTIAIALAVGAVSAVGPMKYTNVFTTAAYASSSDADELTSLELETSDGDSLDLYTDSSYDDELDDDLSVGDTYYAKTSASKIVINSIDGADDDNVRIFKGSSSKAYEVGDDISVSSNATTTLKVRVYEDEYDEDEDYSSSDYNQYTIVVKNTDDASKTYTLNISKTSNAGNLGMFNQQGNGYGFGNQNGNRAGNGNQGFINGMVNGNGEHKGGWKQISGLWYYLDNSGQNKTGWLQDTDGKWYYLQQSGAMASNTVIDGYKLGADGAWIK